jgi:small subunit ribosomal protein S1
MSDPINPKLQIHSESEESFADLLTRYEQSHSRQPGESGNQLEGTVIALNDDSVILDIGYKSEGILPLQPFRERGEVINPGDKFFVTVTGRNPEGYYELSRSKVKRATDWSSLEQAFADKTTIVGTVTAAVKGGLSVDVGVRAFMPASRSGTRDATEMESLIGQEIRCRITKLDVDDEDVVVDRRAVLEEEEQGARERRYSELNEGDTLSGTVRSLTDYGAFVDIGGVDGLLHIGDMSLSRIKHPSDLLAVGQQIEARVLKIDPEKRRISLGLKQLQAQPWETASEKYKVGERVRGVITRLADFGAFVELEPGIEGLIHISEMSWARRVKTPSDVVKPGETVEAVILDVNVAERRISLGLKQTLGDPWSDVAQRFAAGAVVEGPVTNITSFGAFVQVAEGVEGMIHISEIGAEKRINHPQDALKVGQVVKAQVLAVDPEKRLMRLSIKQLVPTSLDEYLAEHADGDVVTGRVIEIAGDQARIELGEGIQAGCRLAAEAVALTTGSGESKPDLSSLSSMLKARWKGGDRAASEKPEALRAGQVRSFRITRLDREQKTIALELASGER